MRTAVRENRQVEGASEEDLRLPGAGKAGSVFIMKVNFYIGIFRALAEPRNTPYHTLSQYNSEHVTDSKDNSYSVLSHYFVSPLD